MNEEGGAAEQKVSHRVTGEGAVEAELAISPVSADPIELDSLH
jgi:hypothetical protein